MTVFENIAFGLKVKRLKQEAINEKVESILSYIKLEGLAGRYPQEMSGGQQQRVALARMLVSKPAIFLMDEPLSNLDARLRLEMRAEIKNIHYQTGATTVYVTHDQVEGLTMANRIAVLNQGKIEQLERPKTVYSRPATLFVSDFIGSPSMNKIEGKTLCEQHEGGIAVDCGLFTLQAGREVIAAIRPENISVVSKPEANTPEAGRKIRIFLPPEQILIFAKDSGRLLPFEGRNENSKV